MGRPIDLGVNVGRGGKVGWNSQCLLNDNRAGCRPWLNLPAGGLPWLRPVSSPYRLNADGQSQLLIEHARSFQQVALHSPEYQILPDNVRRGITKSDLSNF